MTTTVPVSAPSAAVTLPEGTTLTPATHPDGWSGIQIREGHGLATVFVGDVDGLIRALAQFRAAQPAVA